MLINYFQLVCNYYIVSSAVRYHVWSLLFNAVWLVLYGTNTQCYNQATGAGYSDSWFSVACYNWLSMQALSAHWITRFA